MRRTFAVCALAAVLALTGCAGRGRARSDLRPAGNTSSQTQQKTATSTHSASTSAAGNPSADLAAVDSDLSVLDKQLSILNTQLTDADKAADDDN